MMELSQNAYLWIKALHVISVIAWMAGLLYLPRLFVYHCGTETGSEASETFKVMERRLYRAIMNPAMVASIIFGGLLLMNLSGGGRQEAWLQLKLLAVAGLLVLHVAMGSWRRAFAQDRNRKSEKFFRVMNEAPTLLMVAIVILAVVKPF
ncbi:MAG TPA: protoporphyrinogen oxidase HemJ [Alphaproteobacteria bacterium]|nr:protoporphyrinogen oxidase HemJ [Alphaproteobacteria bacterium]